MAENIPATFPILTSSPTAEPRKSRSRKWERAGVIGIDAGLCWIGDPCYVLHKDEDEKKPRSIGRDWGEFCDLLGEEYPTLRQFDYDMGHPGLGVCVSTGYGDGVYPVEVRRTADGRVAEVRIVFIRPGHA